MKRLIFVLGTAYSGSTAIGKLVHEHFFDTYFLGEVSRIPSLRKHYNLDNFDGKCVNCQINEKPCSIFNETISNKLANEELAGVYKKLGRVVGADNLVDSSKHPAWLREILKTVERDKIFVVVSVKDPIDYTASCVVRGRLEPWMASNIWRDIYFDGLRLLNTEKINYIVIRNEDVVKNSDEVLQRLSILGSKKGRGKKLEHCIGSNPAVFMKNAKDKSVLRVAKELGIEAFDLNPLKLKKQKINKEEFRRVALQTPGLNDLAVLLGYQL